MDQKEYNQKQINALAQFSRHGHNLSDKSQLTRENCSACALAGDNPKGERRDFINNAGWARVYIQAGKYIPLNVRFSFLAELASENRAYAEALKQDIRDFGINCEKPSAFFNAIRDVLEIYD